jgi:putative PIN family toxin of toxin-antitoxin system
VTTAVVDTNVLASGFVRPEPAPGQLLTLWRAGAFVLVVSEHILAELARAFEEPYFARRLTPSQRANNLALVRDEAVVAPITVQVRRVATHPEDDLVIATAVSSGTDYLVTGDRMLQNLGTYEGITILSPRGFVEWLSRR